MSPNNNAYQNTFHHSGLDKLSRAGSNDQENKIVLYPLGTALEKSKE